MNPVVKGRAVGFGIVIVVVVLYFVGHRLVNLTAHAESDGYLLWIHDGDVAPGGSIAVRVKRDSVFDPSVGGVSTRFAGKSRYHGDSASDVSDLDVSVPDKLAPGTDRQLSIRVGDAEWTRTVTIHTPAIAVLRRAGRAAGALAIALAVAALLASATRYLFRRGWPASRWWYVLVIPHVVLGYFAFSAMLAAAIGTHALPFHVGALVVWSGIALVPGRTSLRRAFPRYAATSALIQHESPDAPYRGARTPEVIESVATLEAAWSAAGLLVRRRRNELVLTKQHVGAAVVPIARSETFGGEPFDVHTRDPDMARTILHAAAKVLGPLRATSPDGTTELVFEADR